MTTKDNPTPDPSEFLDFIRDTCAEDFEDAPFEGPGDPGDEQVEERK